jgi:hypothetical protein
MLTLSSISMLLSCKVDISEELNAAIKDSDYAKMNELLQKDNILGRSKVLENSLKYAAAQDKGDAVTTLINAGADPNVYIDSETPVLLWALQKLGEMRRIQHKVYDPYTPLITCLIQNGVDVNISSDIFETAAAYLPDELFELFIENGLTFNGLARIGGLPVSYFEYLVYRGRINTAIKFAGNTDVMKDILYRAYHMSDFLIEQWRDNRDYEKLIDTLYDKGFEFDKSLPLLHFAISLINIEAVDWLLNHGWSATEKYSGTYTADRDRAVNAFHSTPLEWADIVLENRIHPHISTDFEDANEREASEVRKIIALLKSSMR